MRGEVLELIIIPLLYRISDEGGWSPATGAWNRRWCTQVKLRQVSWFDYLLTVGLSIVFALVFNLYNDNQIPLIQGWGEHDAVAEVTLNQALEAYRQGQTLFVDARKNSFYEQRHIKGGLNLPVVFFELMYPMFQFSLTQMGVSTDKPLIVYGGTVSRGFDLELARLLKDKGFDRVAVLRGDYQAWPRAFPVEEGKAKKPGQMPLGLAGLTEVCRFQDDGNSVRPCSQRG